jgi:hypothetical protein
MDNELNQIIAYLVSLGVSSREDMKQQIAHFLEGYEMELLDSHNTTSMIFIFSADGERYGVKIEYGQAEVMRDEAHWYDLAPPNLKTHHVISHIGEAYAFVLLRWLQNARTVEEIAIANEGQAGAEAAELMINALEQDRELFANNLTLPLTVSEENGYFLNKYHGYNAGADKFPYLLALLESRTIRVNGKELPGPHRCVEAVQRSDSLRTYLTPDTAGLIHGDTHADNLLVDEGKVYLIDPKGVDHLPIEYDTGRILWSFTGWNAIVRGEFTLAESQDGYQLEYTKRSQYMNGLPQLRASFSDQEYHRAMYSAAMQYVTRISHATHEAETKALYLRGLQLFDELFQELGEKV